MNINFGLFLLNDHLINWLENVQRKDILKVKIESELENSYCLMPYLR